MKASELLNKAIPFYGDDDFMCHTLMDVEPRKFLELKEWLKDHIQETLNPKNTITLMNFLKYTSVEYATLAEEYGQRSEQCHNWRIEFWRKMVLDLQNKGL